MHMHVADLDELLPSADIVIILLPLTPETHHVVDARFLSRMKKGALLINAGRYDPGHTAYNSLVQLLD